MSVTMSKVCGRTARYRPMNPSSRASDPVKVYRKNFSAAARARSPCPQPAMMKYIATMDRSKYTKNTIRFSAVNRPRQTVSRNRNRQV
jgi:hypothetical protein